MLPQKLNISHDMPDFSVPVLYTVFQADTVPFFLQFPDTSRQLGLIFLQNRRSDQIKAFRHHFFLGFISKDLQRRPVNAQNLRSVYRVTYHAAVNGGENRFQRMVFPDDFLFISPLFGYINRNPDRSHHAAVQIIQRGFISSQQFYPVPCLNRFFRHMGLLRAHDLIFRFNTGRVILFHIPDVSMGTSLYLLFGLADGPAKAVVYFFMNPVDILKPNQVGRIVDGRLQKMTGFPKVLGRLVGFLPLLKAERDFPLRKGQRPNIFGSCIPRFFQSGNLPAVR